MTGSPATTGRILVVGIGSPDRGDDAWGPVVAGAAAREVAGRDGRAGHIGVLVHEDPTDLVQAWGDADLAIVLDAVLGDAEPGTLVVTEMGADSAGLPTSSFAAAAVGGTHAFGLASAVELSRALGRLPRRVVLVGVQPGGFDHAAPMSAPVAAAIAPALETVDAIIGSALSGGPGDVPR